MADVFFITGAASGIGRHLTTAFARRGHRVLAADLAIDALEQSRREQGWSPEAVHTVALDVRDPAAWRAGLRAALSAFGRVDVLLNVAGVLRPGHIWETTDADVDLHLDVNVKGVVHGMRVVGEHFRSLRRGHIVNFGSLASLAPVPGLTLYSASKFAVRGLSLAAAQELGDHGVAVTVVMPDAVMTPMLDLQLDYAQAALTFSGSEPLTVQDVELALLEKVLPERPLEFAIPWSRGALARVANTVPASARLLRPLLERKGLAAQAERRRR